LNFSRQQLSPSVMVSLITALVSGKVSVVVVDQNGGYIEHTFH